MKRPIFNPNVLRQLARVHLRESERLKCQLQEACKQLHGKDAKKAEQLALRLAQVQRQRAAARKLALGQTSERRLSNRKRVKEEAPQSVSTNSSAGAASNVFCRRRM